jgi:hypothetical protein
VILSRFLVYTELRVHIKKMLSSWQPEAPTNKNFSNFTLYLPCLVLLGRILQTICLIKYLFQIQAEGECDQEVHWYPHRQRVSGKAGGQHGHVQLPRLASQVIEIFKDLSQDLPSKFHTGEFEFRRFPIFGFSTFLLRFSQDFLLIL